MPSHSIFFVLNLKLCYLSSAIIHNYYDSI